MGREDIILHSDLNCFYASVEMNEKPALREKLMAVCGSTENRHGIVLTANYPAKRRGVKTGMANWQARQVCPELVMVEPHYDLYLRYSAVVRDIYRRYADRIEPFGMDENWISIPCSGGLETDGRRLAERIRRAVREETGLTVSVGVSFNKIFAKLGSDMKKPDAVTVVSREDFREKTWGLPLSDLLYAGPATTRKMALYGIYTIGDLATADPALIKYKLGKNGLMLRQFANGEDVSPVMPDGFEPPIKSVGHGTTCVRDLTCPAEVWQVIYEMAQDVGHRLRRHGCPARGVEISVRDSALGWYQWQMPLAAHTQSPYELAQLAYALFREHYLWQLPVRALTVTAVRLTDEDAPAQTDMFLDHVRREKRRALEDAVDALRGRFGERSVVAASLLGELPVARDRCETVPMPAPMYR